jgi:ATP-binding cassette subfamily B protein
VKSRLKMWYLGTIPTNPCSKAYRLRFQQVKQWQWWVRLVPAKHRSVSLMARFYEIQQGAILLDGVDIRCLRQHDLRRHVGAVPQDPTCFSGTIRDNIRLHDTTISEAQVRGLRKFRVRRRLLTNFLARTITKCVSVDQICRSGQRQLLAFARAMVFNPEVMLILDEATSSVDTETEQIMQVAVQRLLKGRTSLVIAHRLSTIRYVDRILVLHRGKLVEDGTHDELLALNGYYARLYRLQYAEQFGGQIPE